MAAFMVLVTMSLSTAATVSARTPDVTRAKTATGSPQIHLAFGRRGFGRYRYRNNFNRRNQYRMRQQRMRQQQLRQRQLMQQRRQQMRTRRERMRRQMAERRRQLQARRQQMLQRRRELMRRRQELARTRKRTLQQRQARKLAKRKAATTRRTQTGNAALTATSTARSFIRPRLTKRLQKLTRKLPKLRTDKQTRQAMRKDGKLGTVKSLRSAPSVATKITKPNRPTRSTTATKRAKAHFGKPAQQKLKTLFKKLARIRPKTTKQSPFKNKITPVAVRKQPQPDKKLKSQGAIKTTAHKAVSDKNLPSGTRPLGSMGAAANHTGGFSKGWRRATDQKTGNTVYVSPQGKILHREFKTQASKGYKPTTRTNDKASSQKIPPGFFQKAVKPKPAARGLAATKPITKRFNKVANPETITDPSGGGGGGGQGNKDGNRLEPPGPKLDYKP